MSACVAIIEKDVAFANWSDHLLSSIMHVNFESNRALSRVVRALESYIAGASPTIGGRLPSERALATKLGVGRSTVREGLRRLEARGLLETRQGSGAFIRSSSDAGQLGLRSRGLYADRDELFVVRSMIESASASAAARRATPDDQVALASALKRLTSACEARDIVAEAKADGEFHAALVLSSHNQLLKRLYAGLNAEIRSHICDSTFEASTDRLDASRLAANRLAQHRQIFEEILRGQADEASLAAEAHLQFVRDQFV